MTYKPKHILFVTGKDWFKDFEFLYELNLDGYVPKIYVSERLEFKSPSLMATEIIDFFKK